MSGVAAVNLRSSRVSSGPLERLDEEAVYYIAPPSPDDDGVPTATTTATTTTTTTQNANAYELASPEGDTATGGVYELASPQESEEKAKGGVYELASPESARSELSHRESGEYALADSSEHVTTLPRTSHHTRELVQEVHTTSMPAWYTEHNAAEQTRLDREGKELVQITPRTSA
jgi:hypothetical protein